MLDRIEVSVRSKRGSLLSVWVMDGHWVAEAWTPDRRVSEPNPGNILEGAAAMTRFLTVEGGLSSDEVSEFWALLMERLDTVAGWISAPMVRFDGGVVIGEIVKDDLPSLQEELPPGILPGGPHS